MKKFLSVVLIIVNCFSFIKTFASDEYFPKGSDFLKNKINIESKSWQLNNILKDEEKNNIHFKMKIEEKFCGAEASYESGKEALIAGIGKEKFTAMVELFDLLVNEKIKNDYSKTTTNLTNALISMLKVLYGEDNINPIVGKIIDEIKGGVKGNILTYYGVAYNLDNKNDLMKFILNSSIIISKNILGNNSNLSTDEKLYKTLEIFFAIGSMVFKEVAKDVFDNLYKAYSTWTVAFKTIDKCSEEKNAEYKKTLDDINESYKSDQYLLSYYSRRYLLQNKYNQKDLVGFGGTNSRYDLINIINRCYSDVEDFSKTDYSILGDVPGWVDYIKLKSNKLLNTYSKEELNKYSKDYINLNAKLVCGVDKKITSINNTDLEDLAKKYITGYLSKITSEKYNVFSSDKSKNTEYINSYLLLGLKSTTYKINEIQKESLLQQLRNSIMAKFHKVLIYVGLEKEIVEVGIGNYEAPNGKIFKLYQFGNTFYTKNIKFKIEKKFTNVIFLKKYLDSKNPLVIDEHQAPNGKKFKITQYKGLFGIIYPDGTKGKGTFETKEGLIKFLDENNGICHIIEEKYIGPDELIGSIWENTSDGKKFSGKIRSVNFNSKYNCTGGIQKSLLNGELKGGVGYNYHYFDIFGVITSMGGYDDSKIKIIKKDSIITKDGRKGDIEILNLDGVINLYLNIDDVTISFEGKITNEVMNNIFEDFKYIASTMEITAKEPYFNWNKVDSSFGDPDSNSIRFTDNKGIVKIVTAKQDMFYDNCNGINSGVSIGLFCIFKKYDPKTNSVIIEESVERNYGYPSEHTIYGINIVNGKVKQISHKCVDGDVEKCQQ